MTTYIAQNDKNGKEIYYRLEDGKKTKVSRAEYEANQVQESKRYSKKPQKCRAARTY